MCNNQIFYLRPGAAELLLELKRAGYHVGLWTSRTSELAAELGKCIATWVKMDDLFDVVLGREFCFRWAHFVLEVWLWMWL